MIYHRLIGCCRADECIFPSSAEQKMKTSLPPMTTMKFGSHIDGAWYVDSMRRIQLSIEPSDRVTTVMAERVARRKRIRKRLRTKMVRSRW